jgi:hypothetical protein
MLTVITTEANVMALDDEDEPKVKIYIGSGNSWLPKLTYRKRAPTDVHNKVT